MKSENAKEKKGKSWTPKLKRKVSKQAEWLEEKRKIIFGRDRGCYGFAVKGERPVLVDRILEGSPACKAGLKTDDEILRIHGDRVEKSTMAAVVALIQNTVDELDLFVLRRTKKTNLGETPTSASSSSSSFRSYINEDFKNGNKIEKRKSASLSELDNVTFQHYILGQRGGDSSSESCCADTENDEERIIPADFDSLSPLEMKRQTAIHDTLKNEELFLTKFTAMLKDAESFSGHVTDQDGFGKAFLIMEDILKKVRSSFMKILTDIKSIEIKFTRMSSNVDHPRSYIECIGDIHEQEIAKVLECLYDIPLDTPIIEDAENCRNKIPFYDLLRVIVSDTEESLEENFITLQTNLAEVHSCTPRKHRDFKPLRDTLQELRKINQGRLEKPTTTPQIRGRKDSTCEVQTRSVLRRLSWDSNSRNLLRRSSLTFERQIPTHDRTIEVINQPISPSTVRRSTLATVPLSKESTSDHNRTSTSPDNRVWSLRRDHVLTRSLPRRLIPFKDRHINDTSTPVSRQKKHSVTSLLKKPFTRYNSTKSEDNNSKGKKILSKTTSVPASPTVDKQNNNHKMGKKDFSLAEHTEIASPLAKRLPIFRKRQKSESCQLKSISLSTENLMPPRRNASRVNSNNSDGSGPYSDVSSVASDDEWINDRRIQDFAVCDDDDDVSLSSRPPLFQRQRSLTCPQDFDNSLDLERAMRSSSAIGHLASPLSSRSLPRISDRRRKKPFNLLSDKTNSRLSQTRRVQSGGIYCGDDSILEGNDRSSPRSSGSLEQMPVKRTPPHSPLRLIKQHFQETIKGRLSRDEDTTSDDSRDRQSSSRLSSSTQSSEDRRSLEHSMSQPIDIKSSSKETVNSNLESTFIDNHFQIIEVKTETLKSSNQQSNRRHTVSATDNAVIEARKILNKKSRPAKAEVIEWGNCFETLLFDTRGVELFRMFLRSEFSEENILFWMACEDLKQTRSFKIPTKAKRIFKTYIESQSPQELNLDYDTKVSVTEDMKNPTRHTFEQAQQRILNLMSKDSYPRFLKSAIYLELLTS